jgi:8-oxo-dGTP pyrophosphatase MutT (NUDIX family)
MNLQHEVTPRLAATTILVRARDDQPEILLLKRGEHARFMPNAYVFAGGALDLNDESADIYALCNGLDDGLASELLELPSNGLRFFVAAVREAFEECGLLLAYDDRGDFADLSSWDELRLRETRLNISAGRLTIAELCRDQGWRLAVDKLAFFSHWITPPGNVRFDTRFFLCSAPPRQTPSLAGSEMSQLVWRTAAEALAEHANKKLLLMYPTRTILKEIAAMRGIDELFDFARRPRKIAPITPVMPPGIRVDGAQESAAGSSPSDSLIAD